MQFFPQVIYRHGTHERYPARVVGINYHPALDKRNMQQNGGEGSSQSSNNSTPKSKSSHKE